MCIFCLVFICQDKLIVPPDTKALILRNSEIVFDNINIADPNNLELLDLSYIQIYQFDADLQKHGISVDIGLSEMNSSFLFHLRNLHVLNLMQSYITTLQNAPFIKQVELTKLVIVDNVIPIIHRQSFEGLRSLHTLDLHSMSIEGLHRQCFRNLALLKVLNLSINKLESLHEDTFFGLYSIRELDLTSNMLTSIDKGTLSNLYTRVYYVTYSNICCFVVSTAQCQVDKSDTHLMVCDTVLQGNSSTYVVLLIIYLLFCTAVNIRLQLNTESKNARTVAILLFSIADIFVMIKCIVILSAHWYHQQSYALIRPYINTDVLCILYGTLAMVTEVIPRICFFLLALVYLRITNEAMTKPPHTKTRIFLIFSITVTIMFVLSVAMVTRINRFRKPFCTPFDLEKGNLDLLH